MLKQIIRFPVLFGATAGNGDSGSSASFVDIKEQFQSERLAADFPEVCDPIILKGGNRKQTYKGVDTKLEWKTKHVIFATINEVPGDGYPWAGKPSVFSAMKLTYRGLDSHFRGINIQGDRPDAAFLDDLETEESARMDGQIETRENLVDNAVGGLGSAETIPRIILGTIQNHKCLTKKKLDEWGGKRYQAVNVWPTDEDSVMHRDEYIEMRREERRSGNKHFDESYQYYEDHQDVIERGLEMGNPHNKSRKNRHDGRPLEISAFHRVLNKAADNKWEYVYAELQNDPIEEEINTARLTSKKVRSRISGFARDELPNNECKIALGLDLGKMYSHWVKVAVHGNAVGNIINYGIMETPNVEDEEDHEAIELAILKSLLNWRTDILAVNPPDFGLIDSGAYTQAAYEFVRRTGTPFAATKNWEKGRFRMPDQDTEEKRRFVDCWAHRLQAEGLWLYHNHTNAWRQWAQQRFLTATFSEQQVFNDGTLSLFSDPENPRRHVSFSQHIVSWEWQEKFIAGKGLERKYVQVNINDHYLEALAIACCAAGCLGVRLIPRQMDENVPPPEKRPVKPKQRLTTPDGRPFLATERK